MPSAAFHDTGGPKATRVPSGVHYKARDTKLDRDVALKILPDAFASDPERLARFQREAKVLASLNHPNIAASGAKPPFHTRRRDTRPHGR